MPAYIKEQRVVDGQRQLYDAEVSRTAVEVLHAGGADLFSISRTQRQVIQPVRSGTAHIIQQQGVSDSLHTQLPVTHTDEEGQASFISTVQIVSKENNK